MSESLLQRDREIANAEVRVKLESKLARLVFEIVLLVCALDPASGRHTRGVGDAVVAVVAPHGPAEAALRCVAVIAAHVELDRIIVDVAIRVAVGLMSGHVIDRERGVRCCRKASERRNSV